MKIEQAPNANDRPLGASVMTSADRILSALDGIAAHLAILDPAGSIVHVNEAWRRFAAQNDCPDPNAYVGVNYIDACRRSAAAGEILATEAIAGIEKVISGEAQRFKQKYPCHSLTVERWFVMTVTRAHFSRDVVIAHDDVTPLVRAEAESAAKERRLKLSLDAGRMGTFEINLEKKEIVIDDRQAILLGLPGSASRVSLSEWNEFLFEPGSHPFEKRIAETSGRYSEEIKVKLRDASERWLSFSVAPHGNGEQNANLFFGLCFDVTGRKLAEEKNLLLTWEVRHRAKNVLANVLAMARQTAKTTPPSDFFDRFSERVRALDATLDLLTKETGRGVSIRDIIGVQVLPFAGTANQLIAAGPELPLNQEAAQTLGLAFHELASNALKYGALSQPGGQVSVGWQISGGQFLLQWAELGGPEITVPTRRGFGHTVLTEVIEYSLRGGSASLRYPVTGFIWEITAPSEEILDRL